MRNAQHVQKAPRLAIHGILLLDKAVGVTSTGALGRVKHLFRAAKAGHTGTLDPMASGLLPLCFGEATKLAADLLDADKSYDATLRLGVTTTTADAEGEVLQELPVQVVAADIEPVLARFRGEIAQVPPMYSALKRDGKPLYEYARAGVILEREARQVRIHRLEQTAFDGSLLSISVDCSKGTYIRTLAEEIGAALGCGAHLVALRRTRVGALDLADAISLPSLEALEPAQRMATLLPLDALLDSLPRIALDATMSARFLQGQRLQLGAPNGVAGGVAGRVRVYGPTAADAATVLLGMAEYREDGVLAPTRVVAPMGQGRS